MVDLEERSDFLKTPIDVHIQPFIRYEIDIKEIDDNDQFFPRFWLDSNEKASFEILTTKIGPRLQGLVLSQILGTVFAHNPMSEYTMKLTNMLANTGKPGDVRKILIYEFMDAQSSNSFDVHVYLFIQQNKEPNPAVALCFSNRKYTNTQRVAAKGNAQVQSVVQSLCRRYNAKAVNYITVDVGMTLDKPIQRRKNVYDLTQHFISVSGIPKQHVVAYSEERYTLKRFPAMNHEFPMEYSLIKSEEFDFDEYSRVWVRHLNKDMNESTSVLDTKQNFVICETTSQIEIGSNMFLTESMETIHVDEQYHK